MRYAVAHGRRSGRGGAAALGAAAVRRLRAAGHGVVEVEASSLEEARAACEAVVADGVDVLAVAGGDGVVSMATDLCAGTDTAVGILPAGTGNDNARSLGIPLDADGALEVLLRGHTRRVDALHLPDLDRHVLGSVNAALDARIAHRATRLPRVLGAASYTVAALAEIALLPWRDAPTYRITADGSTTEVEALVVTVTNMAYLGGGLRLSPFSDPADGLLDLVVIGRVGPVEALGLLRDVRAGRASTHPAVTVTPVRSVRVEGPADVLVHGDGEAIAPLPLSVRVDPSALRVVAPPLA
ncbi:diacylglycerol/lipid kinase family protein [Ornithinimicrobium sp. LYQ103]|uniref:diacylglycerol/lipid kinase family protein n=1 Tax=Ornithinimicrobium sp. LYQ103 TaxID=3378796 RepID=UPI0038537484